MPTEETAHQLADHDTVWAAVGKATAWALALVGSISLADVQAVLGIIATCLVIVGSTVNLYTALKRKAWKESKP